MNISGKLLLFVQEKKTSEGKPFRTYSTSVGNKQEDGSYLNASMDLVFAKERFPESKLAKLDSSKVYTLEVKEAWPSVRKFITKEGKEVRVIYIFINDATITDSKEINKSSDEVPF